MPSSTTFPNQVLKSQDAIVACPPADYSDASRFSSDGNIDSNTSTEKMGALAYTAFQSVVGATAGFGMANAWNLPGSIVVGCVVTGALLAPVVQKIQNIKGWLTASLSNLTPSIENPPQKSKMSKEKALELLNVPAERVNDGEFIDIQYAELVNRVTPKGSLGKSPLAREVNGLLNDIHEAYRVLKI